MDASQFVWDHFKLNAEQRLKSFNFFVLLSMFADGGVFTALEKGLTPSLLALLGGAITVFGIVFWLVDSRSRELLLLTIPALREIEDQFPESHRLFAIDAKNQGRFVRYTFAFRTLILAQVAFGVGIGLYGTHRWLCEKSWSPNESQDAHQALIQPSSRLEVVPH